MQGLTPLAIKFLPDSSLQALTENQLKSFGYSAAAAVTSTQLIGLTPEQNSALKSVLITMDDIDSSLLAHLDSRTRPHDSEDDGEVNLEVVTENPEDGFETRNAEQDDEEPTNTEAPEEAEGKSLEDSQPPEDVQQEEEKSDPVTPQPSSGSGAFKSCGILIFCALYWSQVKFW